MLWVDDFGIRGGWKGVGGGKMGLFVGKGVGGGEMGGSGLLGVGVT